MESMVENKEKLCRFFLSTSGFKCIRKLVKRVHSGSSTGWTQVGRIFKLQYVCASKECGAIFSTNQQAKDHKANDHGDKVYYNSDIILSPAFKFEYFEFNKLVYSKTFKYYQGKDEKEIFDIIISVYRKKIIDLFKSKAAPSYYFDGIQVTRFLKRFGEDRLKKEVWLQSYFDLLFVHETKPSCYICDDLNPDGVSPEGLEKVIPGLPSLALSYTKVVTTHNIGVVLGDVVDYPIRGYNDNFNRYCLWQKDHISGALLGHVMAEDVPLYYHYTQQLNHPHVHYFDNSKTVGVKVSNDEAIRMTPLQYNIACILFDTYKSIIRCWLRSKDGEITWPTNDIVHEILMPSSRVLKAMGDLWFLYVGLLALIFDCMIPVGMFISREIDLKKDQQPLWRLTFNVLKRAQHTPVFHMLRAYASNDLIPISVFVKLLHDSAGIKLQPSLFLEVITRNNIKQTATELFSDPPPYVKVVFAEKPLMEDIVTIKESGAEIWLSIKSYDREKYVSFIDPKAIYHVTFSISESIKGTRQEYLDAGIEGFLYDLDDIGLEDEQLYFIRLTGNVYVLDIFE